MNEHSTNVLSKLAIELANKTVELADAQATIEELQQQINEYRRIQQEKASQKARTQEQALEA